MHHTALRLVVSTIVGMAWLLSPPARATDLYWTGDQGAYWNTWNAGNTNWDAPQGTDYGVSAGGWGTFVTHVLHFNSGAANLSNFVDCSVPQIGGLVYSYATVTHGESGGARQLVLAGDVTLTNSSVTMDFASLVLNTVSTWDLISSSSSATVNSAVSGFHALIKTGDGTLTLNTSNPFTGKIQVNDGTLSVRAGNRLGTAPASFVFDQVTINNSATIAFTGSTSLNANRGFHLLGTGGRIDVASGVEVTAYQNISGAGAFTKTGGGTLELAATNGYYGGVTLNGGVLRLGDAAAINWGFNNLEVNGGTVALTGAYGDFTRFLGTGVGQVQFTGDGGFSTYGADMRVNLGGNATPSQVTWGSGSFIPTGHALLLSDAGSDGTIEFRNPIALGAVSREVRVADGTAAVDAYMTGTLSGSGGITKTGAGTLHLSVNNTFTGALAIQDGQVRMSAGDAVADTASVTMATNAGAKLTLLWNETIGSLHDAASGTSDAIVDLGISALTTGGNDSSTTFTGTISGGVGLTKTGTGTMTLRGTNTYGGTTTINEGALSVSANSNLGSTFISVVMNGGTLQVTGTSFTSTMRDMILNASGGTVEISSAANSLLWIGNISGTGSLTKTGPGTLDLGGVDSYSGGTKVLNGTLAIAADNKLGTGGDLTLDGGVVQFTGGTTTSTRDIIVTAAGGTLEIVDSGSIWTLGGTTSGTGRLTKTGAGRLVPTGSNSYTGGTTVLAGVLEVNAGADLGAAPAAYDADHLILNGGTLNSTGDLSLNANRGIQIGASGGTLSPDAGTTLTPGGALNGTGLITKAGAGTLALPVANIFTGDVSVTGGTLALGHATAIPTGSAVTLANTAGVVLRLDTGATVNAITGGGATGGNINLQSYVLTWGDATAQSYAGTVSGTGRIFKTGSGTLTLSGTNTLTGDITVSQGTLKATTDAALGDATCEMYLQAGAVLDLAYAGTNARNIAVPGNATITNANAVTLSGLISSIGTLEKQGVGTLTLGGTNSFTGKLLLTGGILAVSTDRNFGAVPGALVSDAIQPNGGTLRATADFTLHANRGILLADDANVAVTSGHTLTIAGPISSSAQLNLLGPGTVVLSGTSNFTGAVNVQDGILSISAFANVGVTTKINLVGDGTTLQVTGTALTTLNRNIGLTTEGRINIVASTLNMTESGVISGSGMLTKQGPGTLTLTSPNIFSGGLKVEEGTVAVATDAALGVAGGALTLGTGSTLGTLQITGSSFTSVARPLTVVSGTGGAIDVDNALTTVSWNVPITGAGKLIKSGAGTLLLSQPCTYSSGTQITSGTLRLGVQNAIPDNSAMTVTAGTLDLNDWDKTFSQLSGAGTVDQGSGTLTVGAANLTCSFSGDLIGSGSLVKIGTGSMTLSGSATTSANPVVLNAGSLRLAKTTFAALTGSVTVNGGTLWLDDANQFSSATNVTLNGGALNLQSYTTPVGSVTLNNASALTGSGTLTGNVSGGASSTITASGNLTLGSATSFSGFRTAGTLAVANYSVTLNNKGFVPLGALTTLAGGTLSAPNGVTLGMGSNFSGRGSVNAKVAAGFGSVIEATGTLAMGNGSAADGFYSDGTLAVGHYTVILNDSNAAVLGSLTTLGDATGAGTLSGSNGLTLEMGKNLTGYGTVNSAVSTDGSVNGSGPLPADGIRFNGAVNGFGDFTGNVTFAGGYMPGHSPDAVSFENVTLASTNILYMELGGTIPDSQYDQLLVSGTATLGGTLDVDLINGFTPAVGNTFALVQAGVLSGSFAGLTLPPAPNGTNWVVNYNAGGISLGLAVPEPSVLALLAAAAAGGVRTRRRRA